MVQSAPLSRLISLFLLAGLLVGCSSNPATIQPEVIPIPSLIPTSGTTQIQAVPTPPEVAKAPTLTPEATQTSAAPTPPDPSDYTLSLVVTGLDNPVFLTFAPDGSGRLFIVDQGGTIRIQQDGRLLPKPFLDLTSQVTHQGQEQGLLGLAFHPAYASNGLFYVYYTDRQGNTTIERFRVSVDPNLADADSGVIILRIDQPYSNHNGGDMVFGPDDFLYIGMGDGGSGGDPQNRAQNLGTLLGKLLRIDVNSGNPYGIPADNPFVGKDEAKPEIWAYGLRNPWRFSFDRLTGDLYIADVGQNAYEEVSYQPAGSAGGQNYGWSIMEGLHNFNGQVQPDLIPPVAEYPHSGGNCSITGGYVYRGQQLPGLQGVYLFGDFCTGDTWSLVNGAMGWESHAFLKTGLRISSFGEDALGELYILDWDGKIYQIVSR